MNENVFPVIFLLLGGGGVEELNMLFKSFVV